MLYARTRHEAHGDSTLRQGTCLRVPVTGGGGDHPALHPKVKLMQMGARGLGVGRARCGAVGRCAYGAAQPFEALKAPLCVRYDGGARDPLGPIALEVGSRPVAIDVLGVIDGALCDHVETGRRPG